MKFKICGDLEAPDWVLAEIAQLADMSQKDVIILVSTVMEVFPSYSFDTVESILLDKNFPLESKSDTKGSFAVLRYIVVNAVKYEVEETLLVNELEQMGLKRSHCSAIIGPFRRYQGEIRKKLEENTLQLSKLDNERDIFWQVKETLDCQHMSKADAGILEVRLPIKKADSNGVQGNLNVDNPSLTFNLTTDKVKALVMELRRARKVMEENNKLNEENT